MATARRREVHVARYSVIVLLLVVLLISCLSAAAAGPRTEVVSPRTVRVATAHGVQAMPDLAASGQALVKVAPGTSRAALIATLQAQGCDLLHSFHLSGWALVQLPAGKTVTQGVSLLQGMSVVRQAEPDRMAYPALVPNDPMYAQQYQWPLTNAPNGWTLQTGNPTTVVAIVDSGIQFSHPDLASKFWTNPNPGSDPQFPDDVHGWNFIEDNNDPEPIPVDGADNSNVAHGTHVAGLVGAATNNSLGVAGMDWHGQLMPVKIFSNTGGSPDSIIIAGFEYAVEKGANVINMSLGGAFDDAWTDPITTAYDLGITVVCAAGNSAQIFTDSQTTWASPVCNDGPNFDDNHVLGVAACDSSKVIAFFSNLDASSHHFVDVVAPGVNILSTLPVFAGFADFSNLYGQESGTSMACPITAGLVALVHAQYPAATPGSLINRIRNACANIDAQNPGDIGMMGAGLINVASSLADLPPGAARSVLAFAPPNSEGGSITVSWTASPDDGGGEEDVAAYTVYKAPAVSGPFAVLTSVPATGTGGSYSITDSPVPNNVPYWYRVDTADNAAHVTPSLVAGPTTARDTDAPLEVTTLVAVDTPTDTGGSISLDWTGFSPDADDTGDFAHFNIYRATSDFTSITGMTPLATVSNVNARTYVDGTTTDAVSYWYAVTDVDSNGNEGPAVQTAGPVQSFPNLTITWPAGLNMIALPLTPPDPDLNAILGITTHGLKVARWDPTALQYVYYANDPSSALLQQAPGRGFWMQTASPLTVNLSGLPAPVGNVAIPLSSGWLMLGNPYSLDVELGTATVTTAGTTESLNTSNANGHTINYAWTYDPNVLSYKLISANFSFASPVIKRGQGIWFFSNVLGSLTLIRPIGALQVAAPAPVEPAANNWSLRLQATVAGQADTDSFLGVSPQAAEYNGVEKPPLAGGGVQLFFGVGTGGAGALATSFVTPAAQSPTWEMGVLSARPGAEVTIAWPDLTTLPNSVRPLLTDLATGTSVYMRSVPSYRFVAGQQARRFRLSLASGATVALTSATATATSSGAEIAYTLAAPATVSVEIMNLSGRVIRVVSAERLSPAGVSTLVWDGRGNSGTTAPSGLYLVRITAQNDTGERAVMLRSLSLRR